MNLGAMDIIVIQQADDSLLSTSFFVQFGILDIFKTRDKHVEIEVNDVQIHGITGVFLIFFTITLRTMSMVHELWRLE